MPLLPSQMKPLAPITWSIGRAGEAPDLHPGVILDMTTVEGTLRDGTPALEPAAIVVLQLTAQAENGGHTYLSMPRRGAIPTRFLWPRATSVDVSTGEVRAIPGLDDFTSVEDIQTKLMEDNAAFLATLPASTEGQSLEARANEIAAQAKAESKTKADKLAA
jgi:hypothetical protein